MNTHTAFLAACFALVLPLAGQSGPFGQTNPNGGGNQRGESENQGDREGLSRFWQANLPGGTYMIQLDRISSISRHRYLLDGSVVVDEVTIDSIGQAIARFYHLRPLSDLASGSGTAAAASRVAERARDLAENTAESTFGTKPSDMVVKKYPETTHARTIEFRVETADQLTRLFNSARNAWEANRGRSFTLK